MFCVRSRENSLNTNRDPTQPSDIFFVLALEFGRKQVCKIYHQSEKGYPPLATADLHKAGSLYSCPTLHRKIQCPLHLILVLWNISLVLTDTPPSTPHLLIFLNSPTNRDQVFIYMRVSHFQYHSDSHLILVHLVGSNCAKNERVQKVVFTQN